MRGLQPGQLNAAVRDLHEGLLSWRLAHMLAWQDIKQRYRRSTLGPFWLTLSSAVQILSMSVITSFLFNTSFEKALPFVCSGMLFWGMITQSITEGASLFVGSSTHLLQIKRPFTLYLIQLLWRNVIITSHNMVTYVVIAVALMVVPSASVVLWPLGFILVLISVGWIALLAAIVSTRYRDVPLIIQNLLAVMFWFTPLIYVPEQLGSKQYIADWNPFTHMINLLRMPLLGQTPSLADWLVVFGVGVVGWGLAIPFFARYRARIVYWL